jgi:EpsI family protein
MGKTVRLRAVLLAILLFATGLVIHAAPKGTHRVPTVPLAEALAQIGTWKAGPSSLTEDIRKELRLDDFINATYTDGKRKVFLYVGYYYSTSKVGASHSPLVCYPGQGWIISNEKTHSVSLREANQRPVDLATIRIERGDDRHLAAYWFQSYDMTASDTFRQKVHTLYRKFSGGHEANAFVRVSVPIGPSGEKEALETALDFVGDFQPRFLFYLRSY